MDIMDINQALLKLSNLGIEAEVVNEIKSKSRILGGKASKTELGFNVYSQPFSIIFDEDHWILITSGPGQLDQVEHLKTLDSAIEKLCVFYKVSENSLA
jgi:hypothetical protein